MVIIVVMLVDVAKNNLVENSDGNPNLEVKSYMKANSKINSVKIEADKIMAANVSYAKVENKILTREQIVNKAVEFFAEYYPKVAGKKAG